MKARELAVEGAIEFTPQIFTDTRGDFVSVLQESVLEQARGMPLFPVTQASLSVSRRGVVRGVHYTMTPPGMARYVHCPSGRVLDFVVDLRVGSPTFGQTDSVVLDSRDYRGVYLPVGVGHAFVALEDDTVVSYLMSLSYTPSVEMALTVFDPELGIALPPEIDPIMSPRDTAGITMAEAMSNGLLPDYAACRRIERHAAQRKPEQTPPEAT